MNRSRMAAIAFIAIAGLVAGDTAMAARRFNVDLTNVVIQGFRPAGTPGCPLGGPDCPGSVSGTLEKLGTKSPTKCIVGRRVTVYQGFDLNNPPLGTDTTDLAGNFRVENIGIPDSGFSYSIVIAKRKFGPAGRRRVCLQQAFGVSP